LKHEEYGPARDDAERAIFSDMIARSFGIPRAECPTIIDRAGRGNVRVVREDARPIAGLALIPMGQWFGGKRVAMTGIAAVAVEPFARGRGAAKRLLTSMLHELHAKGVALSTLYPSTQSLYRNVGYEQAGSRFELRARCADLSPDPRALSEEVRALHLVRLDRPDDPRIRAAYREVAQRSPGWLDREDYLWGRLPEWRGETREAYAALSGHDLLGYLFLAQKRAESGRHDLHVYDFVAVDSRAARRLFAFLALHRSMADDVVWYGGIHDALLMALPEMSYRARLLYHWMMRIVDVRTALEQRGYSASVQTELHLEVHDEVLPANNARFILHVENGHASVKPGGKGRIEIDVRALATLYSGFLSAESLAAAGRLKAEKNDLARASAVFAGQAPTMPDMF
jgi:predicted acetyltransferase